MKKERKRSKPRTKVWVLLFVLIVFGVIIGYGLYQSWSNTARKTAAEYFEIVDPTVNNGEFVGGKTYADSTGLKIYSISFSLKAVGGDAHNVVVKGWGNSEPVEFEIIQKDQSESVELTSSNAFFSSKGVNGMFSCSVKVYSAETSTEVEEATIKFNL